MRICYLMDSIDKFKIPSYEVQGLNYNLRYGPTAPFFIFINSYDNKTPSESPACTMISGGITLKGDYRIVVDSDYSISQLSQFYTFLS